MRFRWQLFTMLIGTSGMPVLHRHHCELKPPRGLVGVMIMVTEGHIRPRADIQLLQMQLRLGQRQLAVCFPSTPPTTDEVPLHLCCRCFFERSSDIAANAFTATLIFGVMRLGKGNSSFKPNVHSTLTEYVPPASLRDSKRHWWRLNRLVEAVDPPAAAAELINTHCPRPRCNGGYYFDSSTYTPSSIIFSDKSMRQQFASLQCKVAKLFTSGLRDQHRGTIDPFNSSLES